MTKKEFQPKGEEQLRQEAVENYGLDEEQNKETIDKIVADRLKDEEFKASLHEQKQHRANKAKNYEQKLQEAGLLEDNSSPKSPKGEGDNPEKSGANYVTKEELQELEEKRKYSFLNEDEYGMLKAEADRIGKSKEQVIQDNPVWQTYLENVDLESRTQSSVAPPSRKTFPVQESGKITSEQKDFARKCGNDPEEVYKS